MTRWYVTASSCLLALWALGGWWTLRRAESKAGSAAQALLSAAGERFGGLSVSFRGPVAFLSGEAQSRDVLVEAERKVREELRVDGWNPVLALTSTARIQSGAVNLPAESEKLENWRNGPQAWVLFCAADGNVKLAGVVPDVAVSVAMKREVDRVWEGWKVTNSIRVDAAVQPVKLLKETIKDMPRPSPDATESISVSVCDGVWMRLPVAGDELTVAQALYGTEAKLAEIIQSMETWRSIRSTGSSRLASIQGASQAERGAMTNALSPVVARARAVGPAYVGWARFEDEVWLFGAVASEEEKVKLLEQAERVFKGRIIHVQGVQTDPSRLGGEQQKLVLAARASGVAFGVQVAGKSLASYPVDVSEGRLAADFRSVGLSEVEVGEALIPFREKLAAAGKVKLLEPYLSLVCDGRVILLSGETASASMKEAMLESMKPLSEGMPLVHEDLRVSPLVAPASEMLLALRQASHLEKGKRLALALKPRQVARRGVVYSLSQAAGGDVAAEISRALRSMKKVLDVDGDALFEIVGHTDGEGDVHRDSAASLKQAEEVKHLLVAAGFDELRLAVRGAGTTEPIAENVTENGRALNRRVDIRWLLMESQNERAK